MPPELSGFFKRTKEKPLFQQDALKALLISEVVSCVSQFPSGIYANGMTLGRLGSHEEYFVDIREYRYPRSENGETQKIDAERFGYMDRLLIKGDKITMQRVVHDRKFKVESLPIAKVESIIYMLRIVKQFHTV